MQSLYRRITWFLSITRGTFCYEIISLLHLQTHSSYTVIIAAKCQHLISFLTKAIELSLLARMISSPVTYQIKIRGEKEFLSSVLLRGYCYFLMNILTKEGRKCRFRNFQWLFFSSWLSWNIVEESFWVLPVSVLTFSESFFFHRSHSWLLVSGSMCTEDRFPCEFDWCQYYVWIESLWIPLGWLKIELYNNIKSERNWERDFFLIYSSKCGGFPIWF